MRNPIAAVAFLFILSAPALAQQQQLEPRSDSGEPNGTFPNWEERVIAELVNRARADPAAELASCPQGACLEAACYAAVAPLVWNYDLNRSARFHSTSMGQFPFFAHDTPCVLFFDLATRYPGSSDGSFASSCSGSGTTLAFQRVSRFGVGYSGENIAAGQQSPHSAFYAWLHETATTSACGFTLNNGHRYNILANGGPALGVGYAQVPGSLYGRYWTQDFGGSGSIPKIPSGSHWTQNQVRDPSAGDNKVEFWANWYDTAGPTTPTVVLDDGPPIAMTRTRGTATNGAYTVTVNGVSTACHTYYFAFLDSSLNAVRYPTTGKLGFGAGCPDYEGLVAPAVPTGVNAIATSSTQVHVTWNAVVGATSYDVYRRNPGGGYGLRGSSLTPSFDDTANANTAYVYRVRAVNAGGASAESAYDLATTVMFTDDTLTAGIAVKAVHLAQLRTAVDAVRAQAGLGGATYTDAATFGVTIKAVHITQLRAYLDQAMTALGLATGGFTDASLAGVAVKATHVQEIRNRVK